MYTVKVKSRKILEGKTALKICVPLLVWMIAEFTTFLIAVKGKPFAIILTFLVFFCIIPIVYWMRQKAAEFRGKESFQYEEIAFHTTDGELYVDDIKLDVTYNESQTAIFVNHIWNCEQKYGLKTMCTDFIGIIEEPYLDGFGRFWEEKGVLIIPLYFAILNKASSMEKRSGIIRNIFLKIIVVLSMQTSLKSEMIYDEIKENAIEAVETRLYNIRQEKISGDNVYQFLLSLFFQRKNT